MGDSKYIKTSKTVSFKVMGKPSSINVSASNIEVGQNANIIVNLPSDATGSVVINVNNIRILSIEIKYFHFQIY